MNVKILAIVIVVILVAAGGIAAFFFLGGEKDREINMIAAVNQEGSGIYISSDINKNDMFDFSKPIPEPIPSGWGGKVFGTPGTKSIQHTQLLDIVVNKLNMRFVLYRASETLQPDVVYFDSGITNATAALTTPHINGGILWQPQYQKIIESDKFNALATTDQLYPEHACCVLAGVHSYTSTHNEETVKLLAAFVRATNWVNNALDNKSGADYAQLLSIAKGIAGNTFTEHEVSEALDTVTYVYGNNTNDPLSTLSGSVNTLINNLTSIGEIINTAQDLGFDSTGDFIDRFLDDKFLREALERLSGVGPELNNEQKSSIKVAVISGDIHQIAIHVADKLGFFEEYGLSVTFFPASNGTGVSTAIQSGEANFGLLGAPPLTISVINSKLIKG